MREGESGREGRMGGREGGGGEGGGEEGGGEEDRPELEREEGQLNFNW